jgi:hypothetical protein
MKPKVIKIGRLDKHQIKDSKEWLGRGYKEEILIDSVEPVPLNEQLSRGYHCLYSLICQFLFFKMTDFGSNDKTAANR